MDKDKKQVKRITKSVFPVFVFFIHTSFTQLYTLSLHDALPISAFLLNRTLSLLNRSSDLLIRNGRSASLQRRSEERFSRNAETDLVCRLLLEKKNKNIINNAKDNQTEGEATVRQVGRTIANGAQ